MSNKSNNRKIIKEKEELQARFQIAISQANTTVLSWLKPQLGTTKTTENSLNTDLFMNLPVIALGSGLSLTDEHQNDTDIHTIGDFVNGTKKLSSLHKKKRGSTLDDKINRINNRHRVAKDDSKSTIALKNKIRDSNRLKIRNNLETKIPIQKSIAKVTMANQRNDIDSDDDELEIIQRNVKKGSNLLFDSRSLKKR